MLAAEELCERGWHFHKVHQVWCQPVQGKVQQVIINGSSGEQGHFKVFDVPSWSIQDKEDLFVDWKQCEDPPWRERAQPQGQSMQAPSDGLSQLRISDASFVKDKELKMAGGANGHVSTMQRYS